MKLTDKECAFREKELLRLPKKKLAKLCVAAQADSLYHSTRIYELQKEHLEELQAEARKIKALQEDKEVDVLSQKGQTIHAMAACMEAMARSLLNQPYGGKG